VEPVEDMMENVKLDIIEYMLINKTIKGTKNGD